MQLAVCVAVFAACLFVLPGLCIAAGLVFALCILPGRSCRQQNQWA